MSHGLNQVLLALFRPVQRLPLKFHYFWGGAFAGLCNGFPGYRKDVVTVNLSRSFPDLKYKEIKKLAKAFYGHLGEVFAEAMWLGGCRRNPAKLYRQGLVEIAGTDGLENAFAERSVMVLDSHFGNWELTGAYVQAFCDRVGLSEHDVCVVYKRLGSGLGEDFCRENRCAVQSADFQGYIESKEVLRHAVAHRDERKIYVFPTDQFPYWKATRHEIPSFMGQKTQVMTGGTALAAKLDMAVYYMSADRVGKGRYQVSFRKICDHAAQRDPLSLMEDFYALLEEDVRRNPANYLWSHKRWK